nr:amidase domain-containing protein [Microbacterium ulmi]
MFRRRRAGVLLVVVLIVLTATIVPRIAAAAAAAGVRADLARLVDVAARAVEASSSLAPADASAALSDARAAALAAEPSDEARADAAAALASAVGTYRESAVSAAKDVLGEWSDAEKATEDALYRAIKALNKADPGDLPTALAAASDAADAVRASAQAYRDAITAASAGVRTQPAGGDVDAQLAYLRAHATDYDVDEWGDYNSAGGDCVNFASQGLLARGWRMDDEWYSGGAWKASKAWRDTAAIDAYLAAQGLPFATTADLDRVRVGDVGVFDWGGGDEGLDHTMTVSRVTYSPNGPVVSFASHNTDGTDRPFPKVLSDPASGSQMRIYSIP